MINAFKQIRLTNVNISGVDGRLAVANSGNLAFSSELNAVESGLNSKLLSASGVLSSAIENNNNSFVTASGLLDSRITNEVSTLNGTISTASGTLRSYVDERVSGIIDLAPAALDTLNELAAALGDDENFASNLTNTLTNINSGISSVSGELSSRIASTGSSLQSQVDAISGSYVTLNTTQTISGDKTFAGTVNFNGGFEVGASEGSAALFVSGTSVGINTEAPTEALDVNGNARVGGSLFVGSGINANNKVISNVAAPVADTDAVNKGYVGSVSGDLSSRLASSGSALETSISTASGALNSKISSEVSGLNSSLSSASGVLDARISSEVENLNSNISGVYGSLSSNIASASGSLKSYIDDRVSGVIDMAPAALDTLNELAAALGDDENFASNLTNTLTSVNNNLTTASGALDSRITSEVSGLNSSLSSVSGVLQSAIDTKVASATQKQFSILLPTGVETTGIVFPGNAFASAPTVQVTFEGEVIYQTVVKNRTVSGFDVYFSDIIQEEGSYLNVFASNQ